MNDAIAACARGWIGTRFHHQGRVKRSDNHMGGVDCLGLLAGVARELDLRTEEGTPLWHYDEMDYSHQPDATRLKRVLASLLRLKESGDIVPGDILLLNIEGNPQHLAIVSRMKQGLGIIHAYAPAKAVVEHRLDAYWKERINAVFTL